MLKSILLAAAVVLTASSAAEAQTYVRGYYRSNGTYVAPHYRSYQDGNFYNNWSTYPNINPYTGRYGTQVNPPSYGGNYYRNNYYRNNLYGY